MQKNFINKKWPEKRQKIWKCIKNEECKVLVQKKDMKDR